MPCQYAGYGVVVEDAGRSAAGVSRFAQPSIPELRGLSCEGSWIECQPGAAAMKAWTALLILLPLAAQETATVAKATPTATETSPAANEAAPAAQETKPAGQDAAPASADAAIAA